MAERKLVVVRTPFFAGPRMVGVGEVWGDDDPIVRNYPKAFRPLEVKSSIAPRPLEVKSSIAPRPARQAAPKRPAAKRPARGQQAKKS